MQSKLIIGLATGFVAASAFAFAALSTQERLRVTQSVVSTTLGDKISDAVDRSDNALSAISYTVAAESGTVITVALQMQDEDAEDLAVRGSAFCYAASDANGDTPVATFESFRASTDGTGGTGDGQALVVGTNLRLIISESDGDVDITFQESGTTDYYLCCSLPSEATSCSAVLDFN